MVFCLHGCFSKVSKTSVSRGPPVPQIKSQTMRHPLMNLANTTLSQKYGLIIKSEHLWVCTKIKSLYIPYHWNQIIFLLSKAPYIELTLQVATNTIWVIKKNIWPAQLHCNLITRFGNPFGQLCSAQDVCMQWASSYMCILLKAKGISRNSSK